MRVRVRVRVRARARARVRGVRLHEGDDPTADARCVEVGRGEADAPVHEEEDERGEGAAAGDREELAIQAGGRLEQEHGRHVPAERREAARHRGVVAEEGALGGVGLGVRVRVRVRVRVGVAPSVLRSIQHARPTAAASKTRSRPARRIARRAEAARCPLMYRAVSLRLACWMPTQSE